MSANEMNIRHKFAARNLVSAETSSAAATATAAAAISASAAASATIKTTATTAAAKAAAARLGPRFIHVESARAELITVHGVDGLFCLFIAGHLHKGKSAWLPRVAVRHDRYLIDLPVSCKSLPKFIFTDVEIQIAYINVFHIVLFVLECRRQSYGRFQVG